MVKQVLLACALAGSAAVLSLPAHAAAVYTDEALQAAGVITRAQAIAIAQATVPNTKVISAVFEKSDNIPHWSVDLVGTVYEYEVWVSSSGQVLRVITQPK